ncbi:hypothetical protein GGI07_000627 [Coemansia sp. Benny D115]|nr:hypothetical protein GGI07_000627 [Coemansia sp. Benny D115]
MDNSRTPVRSRSPAAIAGKYLKRSSSTTPPHCRHSRSATDIPATTESPLGLLAALASPSPTTKLRPARMAAAATSLAPSTHDTPDTDSTAHEILARLNSTANSAPQAPAHSSRSPKSSTHSTSISPSASPSVQAVRRKDAKEALQVSSASISSLGSTGTRVARSPGRPSAIPATQLDVLALVTATSPPMPSRNKWHARNTPQPVVSSSQVVTPVRRVRPPYQTENPQGGSDSDTVSEDEVTLRSYSARIRTRKQNVNLRSLAYTPQPKSLLNRLQSLGNGAAADHSNSIGARGPMSRRVSDAGYNRQPDQQRGIHDAGLLSRRRAPDMPEQGLDQFGRDELPEQGNPNGLVIRAPENAPPPEPSRRELYAVRDYARIPPATEPALRRRSHRGMHDNTHGRVLSRQLAILAGENPDSMVHSALDMQHSLDDPNNSSLSSSPLQPNGSLQFYRKRPRTDKPHSHDGSETNTDILVSPRIPGSETETDRSNSDKSNGPGVSPRPAGRHAEGNPQGWSGPSRGSNSTNAFDRRNGHLSVTPCGPGGEQSDGDTTETDDEFFGPPRAVHASIRPPRRVIRHLANLRSRNVQPVILDFPNTRTNQMLPQSSERSSLVASPQRLVGPHSGPPSAVYRALGSGNDAEYMAPGFGLGISSSNSGQTHIHVSGPPRILSTPSIAATSAAIAAVGNMPPLSDSRNGSRRLPMQNTGHLYNSSSQREHSRDTLASSSQELTYRGAALRRLEKSYVRGTANGALNAVASRKRALTAPSSLDPPVRRYGPYEPSTMSSSTGMVISEVDDEAEFGDFVAIDRATEVASTPDLSHLRSHIRHTPQNNHNHVLDIASRTSLHPSALVDVESVIDDGRVESNGMLAETDLPDRPESPSVQAAMRQERKRRHSSMASAAT